MTLIYTHTVYHQYLVNYTITRSKDSINGMTQIKTALREYGAKGCKAAKPGAQSSLLLGAAGSRAGGPVTKSSLTIRLNEVS